MNNSEYMLIFGYILQCLNYLFSFTIVAFTPFDSDKGQRNVQVLEWRRLIVEES